jgi:voltage-gated hydrogen channel 1
LVIVSSFVIDLVVHGIAEEIASLVIVLRLWRFVKVVEEVSVGASERMEDLQQELERLREENRVMGIQLARGEESEDEGNDGDPEQGRSRRW